MTEHPPMVTVIIPTYNSSGTLRLSLETVLRQDFVDFEVWVVGDGCTDDSETVVSSFGDDRVHWVNLPKNSGNPGKPRNEALQRAQGRLVAYLGHDDLWFPWHLSQLVECIDRGNSDFVYSLGVLLGPEGVAGSFTLPEKAWSRKSAISPSNWLHRTRLIDVTGPWPLVKTEDDQDFLQRVLAADLALDYGRQLSVLKFPSGLWRMYSLTSDLPQSPYVEAMHHDAVELRLQLLTELATIMSHQPPQFHERAGCVPDPLRTLVSRAFNLYGRKRWPVNSFLYWRWRRRAGLPDGRVGPGRQ
jgi:glycosyltransferase involved in cell wall biosynthesis